MQRALRCTSGGQDFVGMFLQGKTFADSPHLEPAARTMLDEFAWWVQALKLARTAKAEELAVEEHA